MMLSQDSFERTTALDGIGTSSGRRNAFLCAFALAFCVLAAYPVGRGGYMDDFSYAATALDFARTGHFIYNNWSAATLGWMIPWGALFIKLFGFSFFTLRMAILPFALASVYLFHRVLARFGLSQRNASIGALTLGLSPVFFPLAMSFMTDVPGMFVILACVSMCQRAVMARTSRAAILWLVSAALVNVAGGTARQNAWLGALVMVPATGILLHRRRGVLLASVVSSLASLVLILALIHWFNSRPDAWVDPATKAVLHYSLRSFLREVIRLFFCLMFLMLPLLAAWWPRARILNRWALVRILAALGIMALCLYDAARRGRLNAWIAPWLHNAISGFPGSPMPVNQVFGSFVTFPDWLGISLAFLTLGATLVMVEGVRKKTDRQPPSIRDPAAMKTFLWILGPFSLANVLLLFPHTQLWNLYDRYALSLMPFAIGLLLLLYQRTAGSAVRAVSFLVLAVFTCYSVGDAHDYFADMRAGDFAVQELLAAGVQETSISQSENRDGWVQIRVAGRIHRDGPVEPYLGAIPARRRAPAVHCSAYAESMTPVIQPDYYVVASPSPCLQPSRFPPVSFRAWLPPFHRSEYIEQPIYIAP